MLLYKDSWVWDSWSVEVNGHHHLFFLYASTALHDPDRRHRRASIGHAVSDDWSHWERLPDVVVRGDHGTIDAVATWTGSTVQGDDGAWWLFYTAVNDTPCTSTQRIAAARSEDLLTWNKVPDVLIEADPRWYETPVDLPSDPAWRDPWVYKADDGRWHMLITAHAPRRSFSGQDNGIVGHAVSDDLRNWEVLAPLTEPGQGFVHLEVTQMVQVEGKWWLVFSCPPSHLRGHRTDINSGMWMAPAETSVGPIDLSAAWPITTQGLYAGHVYVDGKGKPFVLAFRNQEDGTFIGGVSDAVPIEVPTA